MIPLGWSLVGVLETLPFQAGDVYNFLSGVFNVWKRHVALIFSFCPFLPFPPAPPILVFP